MQQSPAFEQPSPDTEPADVLAFFAARGSKAAGLQNEIERLQSQQQKQEAQLHEALQQVAAVKSDNSRLSALNVAQQHQAELEIRKLQFALENEFKRVEELSTRLAANNARGADSSAQPTSNSSAQHGHEGQARQQQDRIHDLEQQLQQKTAEADDARRLQTQQQLHSKQQAKADQQHARQLQQQLDDALAAAEAATTAKAAAVQTTAAAEQRAAKAEAALASASRDQGEEVRNLRQELAASEKLMHEARSLKEYVSNVHILKEKLHAATQRAERAEAALQTASDAESQIQALEAQLAHWKDIHKGIAEVEKPEQVLDMLKQLQQDAITLNDRLAAATAETKSLKDQLQAAEQKQLEQEAAVTSAQTAQEDAAATAARLDRQLAVLGKERDGLKRILASYQQDAARAPDSSQLELATAARAEALEAALESLRAQLQQVEAALQQKTTEAAAKAGEQHAASARAEEAEARVAALEKEAEQLGQQVASMQERLGRGEFNPETTRVLHFIRNPEAEQQRQAAEARIAELEAENGALRSQLQALEGGHRGAQDSADQAQSGDHGVAAALAEAEIQIAKRKLAEATKREQRLKEVFNKQIVNFREACYFLFGYRVNMASKATAAAGTGTAPTTFVLTPQHGDEKAQLLFALKPKSAGMTLLPSDYVNKRLKQEVETFIGRFKSIPAFTANLTMENFQKNTQC